MAKKASNIHTTTYSWHERSNADHIWIKVNDQVSGGSTEPMQTKMEQKLYDVYEAIAPIIDPGYVMTRGSYPDEIDEAIAKLFGHLDAETMALNWSDADEHKIKMLTGPHKETIYKAMLAKNGYNK